MSTKHTTLIDRIRGHGRSNVVGHLALFVAPASTASAAAQRSIGAHDCPEDSMKKQATGRVANRISWLRTARVILGLLIGAGSFVAAAPAGAIVGGQIDGSAHPYVGAVDVHPTGRTVAASGVLISPTVFLTAGHVTAFFDQAGISRARVTFDPVVSGSSTWYTGTVHTDPAYDPNRTSDPSDLGVIVFDTPIPNITPASLPTAGMFDQLGPQGLSGQDFTLVGYGVSSFTGGANGGGRPQPDKSSGGTRKNALESFLSLDSAWLRFGDHQDGQPCLGDSGAPNLLGNSSVVAGILISEFGQCDVASAPQWDMRLDSPNHRAFLGQYVTLP
jgi:hypothetical protein